VTRSPAKILASIACLTSAGVLRDASAVSTFQDARVKISGLAQYLAETCSSAARSPGDSRVPEHN
jgi:hypothetical protein